MPAIDQEHQTLIPQAQYAKFLRPKLPKQAFHHN